MSWGVISDMGSVTIRTSDIETSVADAVGILGLTEIGRDGERVHLGATGDRAELTYLAADVDGLELLGLVAPSTDAMHEVRTRIERAGMQILSTAPSQPGIEDAFSFLGPEGFAFEVVVRPGTGPVQPAGFGPKRYGHFNFHPQDHRGMVEFLTRVLDFRVSDVIGTGGSLGYFLRCSSEHHGIAVLGGRGTLHHHAWETQTFTDLAKLGDRLHAHGRELLWAPVRHGAGQNLAAYYLEHSGNVVELYTDMEHIYDDDRPPVEWPDGTVWWNEWSSSTGFLPEGFRNHGLLPTAKR